MEANIETVQKLIYTYSKAKRPLFIHGTMGIGKSDSVRQVAKKIAQEKKLEYAENLVDVNVTKDGDLKDISFSRKYKDPEKHFFLIDIRITTLDPSDLRGIPVPKGEVIRWLSPDMLPKTGQGIILFDEMNLAPPSIQASAYQLILDRQCGEYPLPGGYSMLAAGNTAKDKANIFPLAAPLKNRFSHVELLPPSAQDWIAWAMENNVHQDIVSFIAFNESMIHKFEPKSNDNAFPTHRTVALAGYLLNELSDGDFDSKDGLSYASKVVSTCVGEGFAYEFDGFMKLKNKINIDDLLSDPKKVKEITKHDMKWSLISSLVDRYKRDRNKVTEPILKIITYLEPEYGIFLLKFMKATVGALSLHKDLRSTKTWDKLSPEVTKYLH